MDRYLIISADGHAGPPLAAYRPYLERAFHADFDELVRRASRIDTFASISARGLILQAHLHRWKDADMADLRERAKGAWDARLRMRELDAEGIAAEVIFPDGQYGNDFPFGGFFGHDTPERRMAGAAAHNRWLAEFCSAEPSRMLGLALIIPFDIDAAVEEIRRAHREGLRGVLLSTAETGLPLYLESRYDPLWATCSELELPVHMHGGQTPDIYGAGTAARQAVIEYEQHFYRRRVLVHLMLGGVFQRYPRLKFICTESAMDWIPGELGRLDRAFGEKSMITGIAPSVWLERSPSEYWRRNCAVGATFASQEELAVWPQLGSHTVMWGADYPHVEATWPESRKEIRRTFAAVPDAERRQMLGQNAARLYGFDLAALASIVERIGPMPDEFDSLVPEPAGSSSYTQQDYADSRVFTYATFGPRLEKSLAK